MEGKGAPDPATMAADIPREALPRDDEGHLLRPGVVWCVTSALKTCMCSSLLGFAVACARKRSPVLTSIPVRRFGENLDPDVLSRAQQAVDDADLFITVGTSSVVYPAAGFVSQVTPGLRLQLLHWRTQ